MEWTSLPGGLDEGPTAPCRKLSQEGACTLSQGVAGTRSRGIFRDCCQKTARTRRLNHCGSSRTLIGRRPPFRRANNACVRVVASRSGGYRDDAFARQFLHEQVPRSWVHRINGDIRINATPLKTCPLSGPDRRRQLDAIESLSMCTVARARHRTRYRRETGHRSGLLDVSAESRPKSGINQ
jgi:hypothetical protein